MENKHNILASLGLLPNQVKIVRKVFARRGTQGRPRKQQDRSKYLPAGTAAVRFRNEAYNMETSNG